MAFKPVLLPIIAPALNAFDRRFHCRNIHACTLSFTFFQHQFESIRSYQ
ncbi:hypothetical protein QWZ13_12770 [Reinekea marina]|nr:hypothetical protein [Reinekea marina]MDN3649786.1 hypothetical protein [Reinekea marina]